MTPATPAGKLITSLGLAVGMLWFAMPITIVGNTFEREWQRRNVRLVAEALQMQLLENDLMSSDLITLFTQARPCACPRPSA